jgi:putative copper resistance protein D
MWAKFLLSIPDMLDLLALTTCVGALVCRLWVVPTRTSLTEMLDSEILIAGLWRLLGVCITVLVLSSAALLFARTAEMSGLPFTALLPAVPTVLFKSHYGRVWLLRAVALAVLCIGWWRGRRHLESRSISVFMLCAGVFIAMTRSASGHASDGGDFSIPELMDWLHLMAASVWGGGLIALSTTVLLPLSKLPEKRQMLITHIAPRFSTVAGIALGTVVATGTYNAWHQVESLRALWETSYGQLVMVKILLLFALVILGASNRFISVPLLQQLAGNPLASRGPLHRMFSVLCHNPFRHKPDLVRVARCFVRKVWTEAVLVVVVLICTSFLLHEVPGRHFSYSGHDHELNTEKMEPK